MLISTLTKLVKQVKPLPACGISKMTARDTVAVLVAQLCFFGTVSLSAQTVLSRGQKDWMEKLTHKRMPSLVAPGLSNSASEYANIQAASANAINDLGDIIGNYCIATPACEAAVNQSGPYLLRQGQYSSLPFPTGAVSALPSGINLFDQITGSYLDAQFGLHAFVMQGTHFTEIDAPGAGSKFGLGTVGAGINTQGEVVGQYFDPAGTSHDFIWRAGNFSLFSLPIATSIGDVPTGISDSGDIVGYFYDQAGTSHGYLLRCGNATQIDFPGALFTEVLGINFEGDIVGSYGVPSTNPFASIYLYGFLLRRGQFTTINPPTGSSAFDGADTSANGINDLGVIVGSYQTVSTPESAQDLGFVKRP